MTGMHLKAQPGRDARAFHQRSQLCLGLGLMAIGVKFGIKTRVEFHHRRANAGRSFDLPRIVPHEHADPAARLTQGRNVILQPRFIAQHIQPAFGRPFLAPFGDQTDGMGLQSQGNGLHLFGGGAFEIQRDADSGAQRLDIRVADVATVFAQMGGDAVRPRGLCQQGRPQRIGPDRTAGIPHRCHMVDVHT